MPPARKRLLIVDDDHDIRESLAEVLSDCGYQVSSAANGREAIALLAAEPPPAAILLDLMMPVMDGWQFREAQRADPRTRDIPVVVVSADGNLREKATAVQADAWLVKPIDIFDLLAILEKL